MLEEMVHPQPPTPVQVDNSTALGIATGTIKQCKSKSIDMRFYWIGDRSNQDQFNIYWKPGSTNWGNYFTKHFPPAHHKSVSPNYLHVAKYGNPSTLQGCVNLTLSANHPVRPCAPAELFQLQMGLPFPFSRANDLRSSLLILRTRSLSYVGLYLNLIVNAVNNNDQHVQSGTNVRMSQNPHRRRKRMGMA